MTCHWIHTNVRPPYWNSTSGFHFHTSPQSTCHSVSVWEIISKSDHPRQKKMTSCRFSKWRISAILDCRDPIMGSLKSPCVTLCIRRTLCKHVTIGTPLDGTPMVIFAVLTVFWLLLTIGTLCTNSVPIIKNSQKSKNVHWCTNRHMSTHSPPNTQSPRPCLRLPNTQSPYRGPSIDTVALNCLVFEKIAFLHFGVKIQNGGCPPSWILGVPWWVLWKAHVRLPIGLCVYSADSVYTNGHFCCFDCFWRLHFFAFWRQTDRQTDGQLRCVN